jgi:hypothetical protein
MKTASSLSLALFALVAPLSAARAAEVYRDEESGSTLSVGGYVQTQYRWVDDPCVAEPNGSGEFESADCEKTLTNDGFVIPRTRLTIDGKYKDLATYAVQFDVTSSPVIVEAKIAFPFGATGAGVTMGRFRPPFSSELRMSSSRQQFVDRAGFLSNAPQRQLGVDLSYAAPAVGSMPKGWLAVNAGLFNGESTRTRTFALDSGTASMTEATLQNLDSRLMWITRLQLSPTGYDEKVGEGDVRPVGDRSRVQVKLAGSFAVNRQDDRSDKDADNSTQHASGELAARWNGVSLYSEVYRTHTDFAKRGGVETGVDQSGFGWVAQAGVMVPAPYLREHLEVAARLEGWDPRIADADADKDSLLASTPGSGPANPGGTQGRQWLTLGATWFFDGHNLKLQANYVHRSASEDWIGSDGNPDIDQDVDDDTVTIQATCRF